MTPTLVSIIIVVYFAVLIGISIITSKGADTNTFFTANRQSPWYLVAFGMIGSSLSGVTFISVPGNIGKVGLGYFQIVVGYWVIIGILIPIYYRLNLVSIYTYLEKRFDFWSYKTGGILFPDIANDRFLVQALSCSLPAAEGKSNFTFFQMHSL